jgi:hypothetical protein
MAYWKSTRWVGLVGATKKDRKKPKARAGSADKKYREKEKWK